MTGDYATLFTQWKAMAKSLRAVLRGRGIRVCQLEGNATQRAKALAAFEEEGGVLMLSLDDSFAGLHLPHARHVVFSHVLVGDVRAVREVEAHAVARCLRYGQTREVVVHSFVVSDCAEELVWNGVHGGGEQ